MVPKLICFDWDGTLIDSFEKIASCIEQTAEDLGLPKVKSLAIKKKIGLPFFELVFSLYGEVDEKAFIHHYHALYRSLKSPSLFPHCVPVLKSLHERGIQLAIVTNKARRSTEDELEETATRDFFGSLYSAEEFVAKPSAIMLQHAMTAYQASCEETWMVGDSMADLYAGHKAGCQKILLCEKLTIPPWAENAVIIEDLKEIITCIDQV